MTLPGVRQGKKIKCRKSDNFLTSRPDFYTLLNMNTALKFEWDLTFYHHQLRVGLNSRDFSQKKSKKAKFDEADCPVFDLLAGT
jgi:hypothetical protein